MAVTEGAGFGAAFNPREAANYFFDKLVPVTAAGRAGFKAVRTTASSVAIPRITADPTSAWTAEGAEIALSDPVGDSVVATPHKLAALVKVSNESLNDDSPAGSVLNIIGDQLVRSLAMSVDAALFSGPAASATTPTGLLNVANIQTVAGAPDSSLDIYSTALGKLETAGANRDAAVILMHPDVYTALTLLKRSGSSLADANMPVMTPDPSQAAPRNLWGAKIVTSVNCQGASGAKTAYVVDPSQAVFVWREEASVEVSSTGAGFSSDTSLIRGIVRLDLVYPNPSAVVKIA